MTFGHADTDTDSTCKNSVPGQEMADFEEARPILDGEIETIELTDGNTLNGIIGNDEFHPAVSDKEFEDVTEEGGDWIAEVTGYNRRTKYNWIQEFLSEFEENGYYSVSPLERGSLLRIPTTDDNRRVYQIAEMDVDEAEMTVVKVADDDAIEYLQDNSIATLGITGNAEELDGVDPVNLDADDSPETLEALTPLRKGEEFGVLLETGDAVVLEAEDSLKKTNGATLDVSIVSGSVSGYEGWKATRTEYMSPGVSLGLTAGDGLLDEHDSAGIRKLMTPAAARESSRR